MQENHLTAIDGKKITSEEAFTNHVESKFCGNTSMCRRSGPSTKQREADRAAGFERELAELRADVTSLKNDKRQAREMIMDLELGMRNMYAHARAAQNSQQAVASAVSTLSTWQAAMRDAMTHMVDPTVQEACAFIADESARADSTPLALSTSKAIESSATALADADISSAQPIGDTLTAEGIHSDGEVVVGVYIADDALPRFTVVVRDGCPVSTLRDAIHMKLSKKYGATTAGQFSTAPLQVRVSPQGVEADPEAAGYRVAGGWDVRPFQLGDVVTTTTVREGVVVQLPALPRSLPGTPQPSSRGRTPQTLDGRGVSFLPFPHTRTGSGGGGSGRGSPMVGPSSHPRGSSPHVDGSNMVTSMAGTPIPQSAMLMTAAASTHAPRALSSGLTRAGGTPMKQGTLAGGGPVAGPRSGANTPTPGGVRGGNASNASFGRGTAVGGGVAYPPARSSPRGLAEGEGESA